MPLSTLSLSFTMNNNLFLPVIVLSNIISLYLITGDRRFDSQWDQNKDYFGIRFFSTVYTTLRR